MIGQIQAVQSAKSGNSLRVQVGGQWYSAKLDSGLTPADVGKNITFMLSDTPFPPNSTNYWVNDYTFTDIQTTPSGQAMDRAMTGQAVPSERIGLSQRAVPNKDSLIGAMALCKCCIPGSPEQVFESFRLLYNKLENWDSTIPFN